MRTKTVYDTREIAHLWANQSVGHARNPQSNFSFTGKVIRSYSTDIARLVDAKMGRCVWMDERRYSNTTAKQQRFIRQSIPNPQFGWNHEPLIPGGIPCPVFEVPSDELHARPSDVTKTLRERLQIKARELASTKHGGRKAKLLREFNAGAAELRRFCEWHGLKFRDFGNEEQIKQWGSTMAATEAKRVAAMVKRYEEQKKILMSRTRGQLARWIEGFNGSWQSAGYETGPQFAALEFAYMRVAENRERAGDVWVDNDPTKIETTLGATVPIKHVKRTLPYVLAILSTNGQWKCNGHTLHIGHYQLDEIDGVRGFVTAGCHKFEEAEIYRIAEVLGVATPSADESARLIERMAAVGEVAEQVA
jgi:hypothetical protein